MLDLRRLRILQEVARHGSLSYAARALNYTQPAISHQVRRLEEETKTALITRLGRGVRLTEAGTALVEHVDGIVARMAAAEEEVAAIAGLRAGRVRVVSFPSASLPLMPRALATLKARHAAIEVTVLSVLPPASLTLLRAGECDLVLCFDYAGAPADQIAGLLKIPLLAASRPLWWRAPRCYDRAASDLVAARSGRSSSFCRRWSTVKSAGRSSSRRVHQVEDSRFSVPLRRLRRAVLRYGPGVDAGAACGECRADRARDLDPRVHTHPARRGRAQARLDDPEEHPGQAALARA